MTSSELHTLKSIELNAVVAVEGGELRVTLSGSADSRVTSELMDLVLKAHDEMMRMRAAARSDGGAGGAEAVVDFRTLEFMNSSCFKAFVTWISRIQGLEPESRYRLRFLSDPTKHWQHRSLAALRAFAADLIRVDVV